MEKLILVKLGGSIITDKKVPYKVDLDSIINLTKQLKKVKGNLVIAHGSGSFGHTSAAKYGGIKGYKNLKGIAKVSFDALEINRIVMKVFIEEGLPAISFRPMSHMLSENGKLKEYFFQTVEQALNQGLIPVFYGDVIMDRKWKTTIFSGETILDYLCEYLTKKGFKIDKVIEATKTDGILDEKMNTAEVINKNNWPIFRKFIFKLNEKDVTGGMEHKVEEALKIAGMGIQTLIINGTRKNELYNAIFNKKTKGTLIR